MAYSDITFKDRNPIKRWLQRRRLVSAASLVGAKCNPQCILDFGSGNGELCKLMAVQFPKAKIICYEPTPSLIAEARDNLLNFPHVSFCSDITTLADDSVDLLFCLEVFEHLPEAETANALGQLNRLLSANGNAIIGVPIEIGFPAIYKGIFRMLRRFGAFDASFKNILFAALGSPPKERPVSEIAPGFAFHHEHMGFDYRNLQAGLRDQFNLKRIVTSPLRLFGTWINTEVNFLIQKANPGDQRALHDKTTPHP